MKKYVSPVGHPARRQAGDGEGCPQYLCASAFRKVNENVFTTR